MKKKLKKLFVGIVAVLMVLGNTNHVSAEIDRASDVAQLEITGFSAGGETVDLYQLARASYNDEGDNLDELILDAKLTEGNADVVVKEAVLYVAEDPEVVAGTKSVGDVKKEAITKKVSEMPVDADGKLTSGDVEYDDDGTPKTFNFNPSSAKIVSNKTGNIETKNISGLFPFSTGSTAADGPSEKQISAIAADIAKNPNKWTKKAVEGTVDTTGKKWSVYAYAKEAKESGDDTPAIYDATGIYLGKVNPVDDTVYNPVIVSVGYKTNNNEQVVYHPFNISMGAKYFAPSSAIKKSSPGVDKTVTGGKNENFDCLVVASDLNGNPLFEEGLIYVPPTGNATVGTNHIDPDKLLYVKKTDGKTAAEVQALIKTALENGESYSAYVTDKKEEAYTEPKTNNMTGALGTKFTYELQPKLPSYPENAVNKTLWFSDKMSDGLDYVDGSLIVTLNNSNFPVRTVYDFSSDPKEYTFYVTPYENLELGVGDDVPANSYVLENGKYVATTDAKAVTGKTYYKQGTETKLADARDNADGFNIVFVYDAIPVVDREQGGLIMNYQAVINKNAIKGVEGNPNVVTMVYANNPDEGSTHTTLDEPEDKGNKRKYDKEIVYTYQIQFKKVDEKNTATVLPGAVFGLYANETISYSDAEKTVLYETDELICTLETNEQGIGVTTEVVPGKYYLKEITAPKGYQLNKEKYEFEVKASDAVSETTTSNESSWEFTSEITKSINYSTTNPNPAIDGYLVNSNFYDLVDYPESEWTYADPVAPATRGTLTNSTTGQVIYDVMKAWISKEDHVNYGSTTVNLHEGDPALNRGWIHVADIKNTKTPELPSTGGIGTYLFTIAGVAIIATAAFMLIFRKKEEHNH